MTQKGFVSIALFILVLLLLVVGGGVYYYISGTLEKQSEQDIIQETITENDKKLELTGDECVALGGEIINTLGDTREYPEEEILGEVVGMRCHCICVKSLESQTTMDKQKETTQKSKD